MRSARSRASSTAGIGGMPASTMDAVYGGCLPYEMSVKLGDGGGPLPDEPKPDACSDALTATPTEARPTPIPASAPPSVACA